MSRFFFFCFFVIASPLFSEQSARSAIVVENRVLATVRDQIITVHDVVKKLDMLFFKSFPQYRSLPEARLEFYKSHWRKVLEDLVNRELVLTWAEEKQFQVSHGDVRQELEEMFGPDVMMNVYESGVSFSEAQEMLRADILLRRILYSFVRLPILAKVTPRDVRDLYAAKRMQASSQEILCWRSITVREKGKECSQKTAENIVTMLRKKAASLDDISKKVSQDVEVIVSQQFRSEKKEISPQMYDLLNSLSPGAFSDPVACPVKQDIFKGWRLYFVEAREQKKLPPLRDIEEELRGEIAYPEIEKQTQQFFEELRKQYHVQHSLSLEELASIEPFALRSENASV